MEGSTHNAGLALAGSQSQVSVAVLPSIKSSHFTLAEADLLENFDKEDTDAEEEEHGPGGGGTGAGGGLRRRKVTIEVPPAERPATPLEEDDSLLEFETAKYNQNRRVFLVIFGCVTVITIAQLALIIYILTNWLRGFSFHPDSSSDDDYNIHLIVMVVGSLLLPAYGMLIFRVFPAVPYATLVNYHIAINITALLLTVFGIKIAYDAHHLYAKSHLYSLHSWFGFTIFILQFFELITGNWLYFRSFAQPIMKYLHMVFGSIIFVWSGAAVSTGLMYRTYPLMGQGAGNANMRKQFLLNGFGVLSALFAILVRYLCNSARFRRQPRPEKGSSSSYNKMKLTDADPFTQDTFEYGAARKSIFVGAEDVEEFANSINQGRRVHTPAGGGSSSEIQFEGTSVFYGPSQRRSTITRKSITHELAKLSHKREIQAQAAHSHGEDDDTGHGIMGSILFRSRTNTSRTSHV